MPPLRIRPPRHARPVPGVRVNDLYAVRHMKRRLLNLLIVLSLLASIASLGLWLRGRYVIDELTWRREGGGGERTVRAERRLLGGKGVVSITREAEWHFPTLNGLAPGSPVTDVGPLVVGPPAVPLGAYASTGTS